MSLTNTPERGQHFQKRLHFIRGLDQTEQSSQFFAAQVSGPPTRWALPFKAPGSLTAWSKAHS
jgi:hypothetical protein